MCSVWLSQLLVAGRSAWLVHSNVDCPTTYIAGSTDLIERLLTDDLLEIVEVHIDEPSMAIFSSVGPNHHGRLSPHPTTG